MQHSQSRDKRDGRNRNIFFAKRIHCIVMCFAIFPTSAIRKAREAPVLCSKASLVLSKECLAEECLAEYSTRSEDAQLGHI